MNHNPPLLPTPLKLPPQNPNPVPLRRLSPAELASRRDKGLCFTCDEKYHRGHRCPSRAFLLIGDDDDPSYEDTLPPDLIPDPPEDPSPTLAQISIHSLSGHPAPETLRLLGYINAHPVVILVDGGSTHNFIQAPLAKLLGLSSRITNPLSVMVGNDQHLSCDQLCEDVPVWIQNKQFTVDLHLLPLSGVNLVLGVQWLKALGPILTDYNTLSMKFFHDGNLVELKGDDASTLSLLSHPQVRRLLRKDGANTYFHIAITTSEPPSNPITATLPPELQPLITKFTTIFQPPQALPPLSTHRPPYPPPTSL